MYRHKSAKHSSRRMVANSVPIEHCPARASREDKGNSPRRAACSCRDSVCAFRPRNISLRRQMSASMTASVRYPWREYMHAEMRKPLPGRVTETRAPSCPPGATVGGG